MCYKCVALQKIKQMDKEIEKTTSIRIGELKDKNSLKTKLAKKAKKDKAKNLHSHIVNTLLNFGC